MQGAVGEKNIGTTAENTHDLLGPTNQPALFCDYKKVRGVLYFGTVAVGLDFINHAGSLHCCRLLCHQIHCQFNCMSQAIPCRFRWLLNSHHISTVPRNLGDDQFDGVHQQQDQTTRPGSSMWLGKLAVFVVTAFLRAMPFRMSVQHLSTNVWGCTELGLQWGWVIAPPRRMSPAQTRARRRRPPT